MAGYPIKFRYKGNVHPPADGKPAVEVGGITEQYTTMEAMKAIMNMHGRDPAEWHNIEIVEDATGIIRMKRYSPGKQHIKMLPPPVTSTTQASASVVKPPVPPTPAPGFLREGFRNLYQVKKA